MLVCCRAYSTVRPVLPVIPPPVDNVAKSLLEEKELESLAKDETIRVGGFFLLCVHLCLRACFKKEKKEIPRCPLSMTFFFFFYIIKQNASCFIIRFRILLKIS